MKPLQSLISIILYVSFCINYMLVVATLLIVLCPRGCQRPCKTRSRCTRVPILMDFKMYFCIISLNIYGFIMISNWISQKGARESCNPLVVSVAKDMIAALYSSYVGGTNKFKNSNVVFSWKPIERLLKCEIHHKKMNCQEYLD